MDKCQLEYQRGQKARTLSPLSCGRYKLCEVRERLESHKAEVDRIRNCKINGQRLPEFMRHCTREDYRKWLKSMPLHVGRRLGYDIEPAIDALVGDDISAQTIQKIKADCQPRIARLIQDCGRTHSLFQPRAMGLDTLAMEALSGNLNDALGLIDDILEGTGYGLG